jgi:mannan endo-1,4-beta-mannosidase
LAEVGCAPEGGDKAAWVAELVGLARSRYDRLDAIIWFGLDKERDWRVDHDPAVAAAIRSAR